NVKNIFQTPITTPRRLKPEKPLTRDSDSADCGYSLAPSPRASLIPRTESSDFVNLLTLLDFIDKKRAIA
ncbi:MAG: hypothetical protein ABFD66_11530, partial [Smithella sp.]